MKTKLLLLLADLLSAIDGEWPNIEESAIGDIHSQIRDLVGCELLRGYSVDEWMRMIGREV